MNTAKPKDCEHCNRSVLSLLLLRPSPIAQDARIAPRGSRAIASAGALAEALLPAQPSQSRTVLRLLRTGYVHVHIPKPPPGVPAWMHFRVDRKGELHAQTDPQFASVQPQVCTRDGHNALGALLLPLPQAHLLSEVWIAYSANHWSPALKAINGGNAAAMQRISLQACGIHEHQRPDSAWLRQHVMEFALADHAGAGIEGSDFAFNALSNQAEAMARQLNQAACGHPKTQGMERAVVLADPVGYAAELNAIRLLRHVLYERELAKPENAHPLASSATVQGLKQVLVDVNLPDNGIKVAPLMTKAKFDAQSWPPETDWQPLSSEDRAALRKATEGPLLAPYRALVERPDMGRAVYADHDERARQWSEKQAADSWAKLAEHVDDAARAAWVRDFDARMQSQHLRPLTLFEQDWLAATQAQRTLQYFLNHWDEGETNPLARAAQSPGLAYACESQYIHSPAPHSSGQVLDDYLKLLQKPITDQSAIALRALVGNQQSLIELVHTQLSGDAGDTGMRDKTYDFLKGVLGLDAAKPTLAKFGWMGDALASFSVGQLSAFSGALASAALRSPTAQPALRTAMSKVQFLWGVQQTLDIAVKDGLAGRTDNLPVLINRRIPADEALALLRARPGQGLGMSRSRVKRLRKQQAMVPLTLLTTTGELRKAGGDLGALARQADAGSVKVGNQATKAAAAASAGAAVALNEEQFKQLYQQASARGSAAARAAQETLSASTTADIRNVTLSLDGRLALGSLIVQGIGLYNGLNALSNAKEAKQVRDAWYGIYDSGAGVMGGLLETWAVVRSSRIGLQLGEEAAKKAGSLAALRVVGFVAGAAGGVVNMVASWAKRDDAEAAGDTRAADAYRIAGYTFAGTAVAGGLAAAGAAADWAVARGVGGAVARSIAIRVGAQGTLAIVGGTALTVSGIGLLLLGVGMACTVGAAAMTPTPIQRWLSRSYFGRDPSFWDWDGKRDDMFAKGDLAAEQAALQAALQEAQGS